MAAASPIISLIASALALVGVGGAFLGILTPMQGFMTFASGALAGGLFATVVALIGIFLTRGGADPQGRMKALMGLALSLGLLILVLAAASTSGDAPPINDITTDLANPPAFADADLVPDYRGRDMRYPQEFVDVVAEHYADLAPAVLAESPTAAFERATAAGEALGWDIVAKDGGALAFYARDTSSLFRFVDDIVVRVQPTASGSQIDMRSKSRDGKSDLGANAKRIKAFFAELEG